MGFVAFAPKTHSQPVEIVNVSTTTWSYLADGTLCASDNSWTLDAFDDILWPTGTGLFGWETSGVDYGVPGTFNGGGGGSSFNTELTSLANGGPRADYFRTRFTWGGPTTGLLMTGTVRVDDSLIIFLNGVEVFRENFDPAISYANANLDCNFDTGSANPTGEPVILAREFSIPDGLVIGDGVTQNVLAVLLQQAGGNSSDKVMGLDLFMDASTPPVNNDPTLPEDTTVLEGESIVLTADFSGLPAPTITWYKDNVDTLQTGPTFSIASALLTDSGNYYAVASNSAGSETSRTAVVTVSADNVPPQVVEVFLRSADGLVIATFNEPMDPAVFDPFGVFISDPQNPAVPIGLSFAVLEDQTNWVYTPAVPLVAGVNYEIFIGAGVHADVFGNALSPDFFGAIGQELAIILIDDIFQWKYDGSGADLYTNSPPFYDPTFDDSAWPQGAALLGVEGAAMAEPIRTPAPLNPGGGGPIVSFYRGSFTLPTSASAISGLTMRTFVDDSAVVWINGGEVLNLGAPAEPRSQGQFAARGAVGNAAYEGPFALDVVVAGLVDGPNTIAGANHQASAGSSDTIWGIELIAKVTSIPEDPPQLITPPSDAGTVNEGDSFSFTVVAQGPGLVYQWSKDGVDIPGANGSSYSVASAVPSDAGSYTVAVSNPFGSLEAGPVTVDVTADTTAPTVVSSIATLDPTIITVEFSEALVAGTNDVRSAENVANYSLGLTAGGGALNILSASLNGTTLTLTTDPRTAQENYTLTISDVIDTAVAENVIDPNPTVIDLPSEVILVGAQDFGTWSYNDTGEDFYATVPPFYDPTFDDSTWPTGTPSFYNRIPGDGSADGVLEEPLGTRIALSNAPGITNEAGQDRIMTYFFRSTFNIDDPSTELALQHMLDDGGVFYINGSEVLRTRIGGTDPVTNNVTPATGTSGTDQFYEAPIAIDNSALVAGVNEIAVSLHQANFTSSDIALAVRIIGIVSAVVPDLKITSITVAGGSVTIEHNGAAAFPGEAIELQEASDAANGPWSTVDANFISGSSFTAPAAPKFYRLFKP